MAYLKTCRMEFAYNLLVYSDRTLADIAFLSGYASQSAFTFAFSQHYGCTPAMYVFLRTRNLRVEIRKAIL